MTWKLPEAELRVFRRNTLEAVICQLRFAPILKVHDNVAEFQDRVRERFPGYQESEGILLELAGGVPRQRQVRQHRFLAKGEHCVVVLGDTSVSLEYRLHRERDVLLRDVALVCEALAAAYRSVTPARLGLRYVNAIDLDRIREGLGRSVEWEDVITPEFLRLPTGLSDREASRFASEITSSIEPGQMTVRLALLPRAGASALHYRLDVDRFVEEDLRFDDVPQRLARFVEDIYRVFRAAAGGALLEWMDAP